MSTLVAPPKPVSLTDFEQAVLEKIDFGFEGDSEAKKTTLEAAKQLAESLLERRAIPECRLRYFTEPELNTGPGRMSHKEEFKRHGRTDDEILRHPHFLKYLRYFIYGPDLPMATIEGFCKVINDDGGLTSGTESMLLRYVRSEMRSRRLGRRHAAEEFFKLSVELDIESTAGMLRRQALSVRT